MQNDNLKLKISKFKRLSLRGAKRRSNLLSYFVIASSPEASGDEAIPLNELGIKNYEFMNYEKNISST